MCIVAGFTATAQLNLGTAQQPAKPKQEKAEKPQKPTQRLELSVGQDDTASAAALLAASALRCQRLSSNAWVVTKPQALGLQWDKAELLFDAATGRLMRIDYELQCFDIGSAHETLQAVERGLRKQFGKAHRHEDALSAASATTTARAAAFQTGDEAYELVLSYSLIAGR